MVSILVNEYGYLRLLHHSRIRFCQYVDVTDLVKYAAVVSGANFRIGCLRLRLIYRTLKADCCEKQWK